MKLPKLQLYFNMSGYFNFFLNRNNDFNNCKKENSETKKNSYIFRNLELEESICSDSVSPKQKYEQLS